MDPWASPWADKSTDDAPQPAPPLSQAEAGPSSSSSSFTPPPTSHVAYDHDPWASSSSPIKEEQSPSDQGIAGDAAVFHRDSQPWGSSEKQSPDEPAVPPSLSLSSSGLGASTDAAEAADWSPAAPDPASVDLNDPDADPWADPATKAALAAKAPREDDMAEKPVQPSTTVSPNSRPSNIGVAPPQFVFNPDGSLYRPPTEAESEESAGAATSQSAVTDGKPVSASLLSSMAPTKVQQQQQQQQQQQTKDTKQPPTKSEDPANITSGPGWQMAKPSATKVLAGRFSGWVSNAVARGREGPTVESAADVDGDSGDESNQKDDVFGGSTMSAASSSKGPSQNILDEPAQASGGTNDAAGTSSQGGFWSRWRRGPNSATDSQSQQPPANTIDSDGLDWLSSQSAPAAASSSSQMRSSSSGGGGGGKYSDDHGQGSSMPPQATFGRPAPTNDPFDFSMFEAPLGGTKQSAAPSSTAARAKLLTQPPRRETGPPQAFLSGRAEETEDFDSIGYDYRDGDGDDSDLRAAESDLRGMGDLDWMDSGRYTDRLTPKKPMSRQQNRAAHAPAPANASPPPAMQSFRSSAEETKRPFSPSLGTITLNRSGSTTSANANRNRMSGTTSSSARGSATPFQLPPPPSSSSSSSPSFLSQRTQQKQQPDDPFDFSSSSPSSSSSSAPRKQPTATAPRSAPLFPPPPSGATSSRHSPISSQGMQTSQSQQQDQQKRRQAAISQGQKMTQDDLAFFEGL
ncbi:unnamed protein product [Jaminaea pallidilutea]